MPIQSFKELIVWQKAMDLVSICYKIAAKLPHSEQFCLISQIQRSAISIPSNIAEGKKRGTRKEFAQFLRISAGSSAELETQLLLARKLHNVEVNAALSLLEEVQRMLTTIIKRLGSTPVF